MWCAAKYQSAILNSCVHSTVPQYAVMHILAMCCVYILHVFFFFFFFLIQQLIYHRILVHVRWWSRYYASNERKEKKDFGQINRNPLCLGLRWTQLHAVLSVCPCTTECRESKFSPHPRVGRGLAPTGNCTANHIQQEWVGVSILHSCLNRHHPHLTERWQPCQSRTIKIMDSDRASAAQGAFAMDHHIWSDTV